MFVPAQNDDDDDHDDDRDDNVDDDNDDDINLEKVGAIFDNTSPPTSCHELSATRHHLDLINHTIIYKGRVNFNRHRFFSPATSACVCVIEKITFDPFVGNLKMTCLICIH